MDMKVEDNKRPTARKISDRIEINTQVLFSLLRSNAYIGFAF